MQFLQDYNPNRGAHFCPSVDKSRFHRHTRGVYRTDQNRTEHQNGAQITNNIEAETHKKKEPINSIQQAIYVILLLLFIFCLNIFYSSFAFDLSIS